MIKHLYIANKQQLKANLHCHTTNSDGSMSPEETKVRYQAEGYSVIAFTEHEVLTSQSQLNDDSFLAINAVEYGISEDKPHRINKTYHLNLYATRDDIRTPPPHPQMAYNDIDAINAYIKARTNEGWLVCYNHPYWSLQTYEDYGKLRGLWGIEIYNHSSEMETFTGYNPQVYDEMLRASKATLYAVSSDDNHNGWYDDSCGGWIVINSNSLQYTDVLDAMQSGDFYASQGPKIYEISLDGNILHITCSPCQLIAVYTANRRGYRVIGEKLTEATIEIAGSEDGYIRVMCRDAQHRNANSNAYWL